MVPLGYPWAFPEPPGASRRPPGPKTNPRKKPRNLKAFIKQWRLEIKGREASIGREVRGCKERVRG